MTNYPLEKYHFYNKGTTTIAISTYGGKTVKGTAKVDPRDSFDPEFGKDLAAARCNLKIAEKRKARAKQKMEEALALIEDAERHYKKMYEYYLDAIEAADLAQEGVSNLMSII